EWGEYVTPSLLISGEGSVLDLFVQSNYKQEGGIATVEMPFPGTPNGGGDAPGQHWSKPFDSIRGARRMYPAGFRERERVVIHLGMASDDGRNGFAGGIAGNVGCYWVEDLDVGGHDHNRNGWCYSGPDEMAIMATLPELLASSKDGEFTRLDFGPDAMVDGAHEGMEHYFAVKNGAGAYHLAPIPFGRQNERYIWMADSGVYAGSLPYPGGGGPYTYLVMKPAVNTIHRNDGIGIAWGCGSPGSGMLNKTLVAPEAINGRPTFFNMGMPGIDCGIWGASFHQCAFYDHQARFSGGYLTLMGCKFGGGIWIDGGCFTAPFGYLSNTQGYNPQTRHIYEPDGVSFVTGSTMVSPDVFVQQKHRSARSIGMQIGGGSPSGAGWPIRSGHPSFTAFRGVFGYGLQTPLVNLHGGQFEAIPGASIDGYDVDGIVAAAGHADVILDGAHIGNFAHPTAMPFELRQGSGRTGDAVADETVLDWAGGGMDTSHKNSRIYGQ
ncbi:MAG: hypothetical protein RLZZ200_839, partial [Pseudomonadota bacterium]